MPSPESMLRTPLKGNAALHSHEPSMSSSWANTSARAICGSLIRIGHEVIDIEDAQFDGSHDKARGIDALATGEQLLHQFVLALLQALHAEGHAAQRGDLLLGIAEGEVAQETFVVFVDFVVDKCLLTGELRRYGLLEAVDDAFEDGLVEHQRLALHDGAHIVARQQFTALEDDAVGACVEHVDP